MSAYWKNFYKTHPEERQRFFDMAAKRGPWTKESRAKLVKANLGNKNNLGHHHSRDTKEKMSKSAYIAQNKKDVKEKNRQWRLGSHWYTNGEKMVQAKECPPGYWIGRVPRSK